MSSSSAEQVSPSCSPSGTPPFLFSSFILLLLPTFVPHIPDLFLLSSLALSFPPLPTSADSSLSICAHGCVPVHPLPALKEGKDLVARKPLGVGKATVRVQSPLPAQIIPAWAGGLVRGDTHFLEPRCGGLTTTYLCDSFQHCSGARECGWEAQQWVDPLSSESPPLVQSSLQVNPPLRWDPLHWAGPPRPVDHLLQMNLLPRRESPASGIGSGDGQVPRAAVTAAAAHWDLEQGLRSTAGARGWGTGEPCG